MTLPLDESISEGQADHIADHETIAQAINDRLDYDRTGAGSAARFVGGTASVAPTTGTHAVGDFVVAQGGAVFICTVAGTPGTWVQAGTGTYAPYPRSASLIFGATPATNLNWTTPVATADRWMLFEANSSGAQNDFRTDDVQLGAGTYTATLYHRSGTNRGIYTIALATIDGAGTVGSFTALAALGGSSSTIDGYAGVGANVASSITGIVIPTGGNFRLRLLMATKNASSSDYYGSVSFARFVRTA